MSLDKNTTLGELLGHVSGVLAAKVGDAPAAHRDAALKLTLAEAEELLDAAKAPAAPAAAESPAEPSSDEAAPTEGATEQTAGRKKPKGT